MNIADCPRLQIESDHFELFIAHDDLHRHCLSFLQMVQCELYEFVIWTVVRLRINVVCLIRFRALNRFVFSGDWPNESCETKWRDWNSLRDAHWGLQTKTENRIMKMSRTRKNQVKNLILNTQRSLREISSDTLRRSLILFGYLQLFENTVS